VIEVPPKLVGNGRSDCVTMAKPVPKAVAHEFWSQRTGQKTGAIHVGDRCRGDVHEDCHGAAEPAEADDQVRLTVAVQIRCLQGDGRNAGRQVHVRLECAVAVAELECGIGSPQQWAIARSGLPSPLRSATAIQAGP